MLKKRINACLVVKDGIVVQSIGFNRYLPVGKPAIAVEFLNQWGIDEIIMLDISATNNYQEPDYNLVKQVAKKCHVPLTVGGGVKNINQIKNLMHSGADKVTVNSHALKNPDFISEASKIFGNQCIIVAIDVSVNTANKYMVYDHIHKQNTNIDAFDWAKEAENRGAGELFINAVHRDGTYEGFDITLNQAMADNAAIPVIACGGAGKPDDFICLFRQTKVAAATAANYFHFSEHSVITTKAELLRHEIGIRLNTTATYLGAAINHRNRLEKKHDEYLEDLLFVRIEKEII